MAGPRIVRGAIVLAALAGCIFPARPMPAPYGERRPAVVDEARGWDRLGERWVEGRADRGVIALRRHDRAFSTIRLKAEYSGVELDEVTVVFADGTSFQPRTRLVFTAGSWSRPIELPGGKRVINRVEFRHGDLPPGGEAQLELWAR
jgi:hypothetical protein